MVTGADKILSQEQISALIGLYGAGRFEDSEQQARDLLLQFPDTSVLYNILGAALAGQGQIAAAISNIERAIQLQPDYAEAFNNLGNVYRVEGKTDSAATNYRQAVALKPEHAEAHANLGIVLIEQGKLDAAVTSFERALEIKPDTSLTHSNLGVALQKQGKIDAALASYNRALELDSDNAEAHNNLGIALVKQRSYERAADSYARALTLRPAFAEAHCNLGYALFKSGQLARAHEHLGKAIQLNPDYKEPHVNLAEIFIAQKNDEAAIASYKRALEITPDDRILKHKLAARSGETQQVAPDQYVEELFDAYAHRFEAHLQNRLRYDTPNLIAAMIRRHLAEPNKLLHGLDLGCGTGLSGQAMQGIVETLDGVDLSRHMLAEAKSKNIYADLFKGNIIEIIPTLEPNYDFILAADVLVYVGALEAFFAETTKTLRQNGLLSFSVELLDDGDFKLLKSERFAHSKAYIARLSETYDLELIDKEDITIRLEMDLPIKGTIFLLKKL